MIKDMQILCNGCELGPEHNSDGGFLVELLTEAVNIVKLKVV